jgi:hypothetical protein
LSGEAQEEYLADGMTEEMITQLGSLDPERLGVIARTSAMQYNWEKLLDAAQDDDNPPEAYTTSYGVAIIYARLGDKENALRSLEQAYEERQLAMTEVGVEPAFDALRVEPRFQEVLQRVRLAPQSAETHSSQVRQ